MDVVKVLQTSVLILYETLTFFSNFGKILIASVFKNASLHKPNKPPALSDAALVII